MFIKMLNDVCHHSFCPSSTNNRQGLYGRFYVEGYLRLNKFYIVSCLKDANIFPLISVRHKCLVTEPLMEE